MMPIDAQTYTFLTILVSNLLCLLTLKALPTLSLSPMLVCLAIALALPLGCYLHILSSIKRHIRPGTDYHHDMAYGTDASSHSPDTPRVIIASTLGFACISTVQRYYVLGLYAHRLLVNPSIVQIQPLYALGAFELLVVLYVGAEIWKPVSTTRLEDTLVEKCEMGCQLHEQVIREKP